MFKAVKKATIIKSLFWVVILLVWYGTVAETLRSHGYQPADGRSFTDEEMIEIAAQRAIQRMQAEPSWFSRVASEDGSSDLFRPAFIVPYRDVEHLLEENQKCCYIRSMDGGRYVTVSASVFYKDKSGQVHCRKMGMTSGDFFPSNIRNMP